MTPLIITISILAVLALLAAWGVSAYNRLVAYRNGVDVAWGQVEVQLQRRFDLIPNLVAAVKGYADHESSTFQSVIEARRQVAVAPDNQSKVKAENFLTGALRQIFALSEAYPNLKADRNFAVLQQDLVMIESKLAVARQVYNDAVYTFNTSQQQFPTVIVAPAFGFSPRDLFDVPDAVEQAPIVEF